MKFISNLEHADSIVNLTRQWKKDYSKSYFENNKKSHKKYGMISGTSLT